MVEYGDKPPKNCRVLFSSHVDLHDNIDRDQKSKNYYFFIPASFVQLLQNYLTIFYRLSTENKTREKQCCH